MKKIFFGIIGLLLIGSTSSFAQKIGYCEIDKIITIMPEYETAQAKIEGEYKDVQTELEEMQVEMNNKYKDYTDNDALPANDPSKWSATRKQAKEQELTQLQQRMQEFQVSAQQDLENRQVELLQPISTKLDSAVNVVMKEKGYLFIIKDLNAIQVNKDKCDNISVAVKQKLGLE